MGYIESKRDGEAEYDLDFVERRISYLRSLYMNKRSKHHAKFSLRACIYGPMEVWKFYFEFWRNDKMEEQTRIQEWVWDAYTKNKTTDLMPGGIEFFLIEEFYPGKNVIGQSSKKINSEMTNFKMVQLKEIKPDPNQPRKFYDELAMQELVDSVKEKGILQPILIRPNGKGYILVCGERRFRAAGQAGITNIPAVIRELTDEEALELQIIENLQRKDVHPMEEAVAFKSLLEKGKDVKEIAARVGKSEFYARQRIKLCSLIKEWQEVFFKNRISISDALKVALFEDKVQKELFEEKADQWSGTIEIDNWTIRKYRGNLSEAPFRLDDALLDKKAGACTSCQYNTATALLFEDAAQSPRCNNINCFTNKCNVHFAREFELALQDPEVILVHDIYSQTNDKFVAKAEKAGHKVLSSSQYTLQDPPEDIDPYEEWIEYNEDYTEKEARVQYAKEVEDYKKELSEYQAKIAGGKFKKAFMLTGEHKGKYVFILPAKNKSSLTSGKDVKQKADAGKLTTADIDEEIKRIREREKRAKQIDENHIWDELKACYNPSKVVPGLNGKLSQLEREAVAAAVYDKLSFGGQDSFKKTFSFKKIDSGFRSKPDFSSITEATLDQVLRFFFLDVLPPSVIYNGFNYDTKLCIRLGEVYFKDKVNAVRLAAEEKTAKRNERLEKRIKDLQLKKKELNSSK